MFISDTSKNALENLSSEEKEKLEFHLKTGDYFAFLSTALSFWEDDLAESLRRGKKEEEEKEKIEMIQNLRTKLNYLNKKYTIQKIDKNN